MRYVVSYHNIVIVATIPYLYIYIHTTTNECIQQLTLLCDAGARIWLCRVNNDNDFLQVCLLYSCDCLSLRSNTIVEKEGEYVLRLKNVVKIR